MSTNMPANPPIRGSFLYSILGLLQASRPHIIVSILFTPAATIFLAAGGWPPWRESLLGVLLSILAIASAHIFNDYCDRDIDAGNPRTARRAIVINWVSPRLALTTSLVLLVASLAVAYWINTTCLILMGIGGLMSLLYSAWLKRTRWGFGPPAVAALLLPLGAWATLRPNELWHPVPLINGVLGFCFELVPYWCQTIMDVAADRRQGAQTIPVYYGYRFTAALMLVMFLLSLGLLVALYYLTPLGWIYLLVVLAGGLPLLWGYAHFLRSLRVSQLSWLFALSMLYIVVVSVVMMASMALPQTLGWWQHWNGQPLILNWQLLLVVGSLGAGVLCLSCLLGALGAVGGVLGLYFLYLRAQHGAGFGWRQFLTILHSLVTQVWPPLAAPLSSGPSSETKDDQFV